MLPLTTGTARSKVSVYLRLICVNTVPRFWNRLLVAMSTGEHCEGHNRRRGVICTATR